MEAKIDTLTNGTVYDMCMTKHYFYCAAISTEWTDSNKFNNESETQHFAYSISSLHFSLLCVFRCLQNMSTKITFLQSIFAAFLVVMGPFWQYEAFDGRYPKKPVSVTKKDISDNIYQSIYSKIVIIRAVIKIGSIHLVPFCLLLTPSH